MPISTVNRVKTIVIALTENSGDSVISLYTNEGLTLGAELVPGHKVISFNCFVKNLKAYASISSLEAVKLPEIDVMDSDTQKLYKLLDVEWTSPRKQLDLFISNNSDSWEPIGSLSILNPSGYPYRIYNLIDLYTDNVAIELGDNAKLGCRVKDVGYGYLLNPDKIVIHGSYVEEIFVEYEEKPTNIIVSGGGTSTTPAESSKPLGNISELNNSFLMGN